MTAQENDVLIGCSNDAGNLTQKGCFKCPKKEEKKKNDVDNLDVNV